MKAKLIKSVLRKKLDDWLISIEDDNIRGIIARNTIVTGGCIASMLLNEKINDFDVYFRNKETVVAVTKYYMEKFLPKVQKGTPYNIEVKVEDGENGRVQIMVGSAGIANEEGTEEPYQYFEGAAEGEAGNYVSSIIDDPAEIEDTYEEVEEKALAVEEEKAKYRPVFVSTNAITLSNRVQICIRFYGEPDDIHKNYDFVHCTNYWTSWDNHLELRKEALESLLTKDLYYVGSLYPVCSIFRIRKFLNRGWKINAGQMLKILMQVSELDLKDINILRDQLTGVDCAYFYEVLEKVKEKDPQKLDSAYLIEIIDRIF